MANEKSLVVLGDARKAVEKAHTLFDVEKLVKLAEAVMAVTDSEGMREQAMELYLRARRRRGEIVEKLPKQHGARDGKKTDGKNDHPLTLKEQGIDPHEVKKDYKLLTIPDPTWEAFCIQTDKNFTGALRVAKGIEREKKRAENAELAKKTDPLPDGPFTTIVIDPPWSPEDEGDVDQMGRAQPTYSKMTLDELKELPIDERVNDDAHIYLWITNRSLPKGFSLLSAWGFRYITLLTWCKPSYGIGNYFRGQTEHLMFGVRGSLPLLRQDVGTWFSWPRQAKNSQKPEEAYDLIETCSPGPWLDMFARRKRKGWACWGAEA